MGPRTVAEDQCSTAVATSPKDAPMEVAEGEVGQLEIPGIRMPLSEMLSDDRAVNREKQR